MWNLTTTTTAITTNEQTKQDKQSHRYQKQTIGYQSWEALRAEEIG